jgi:thiamine-phosphate pyrophosphorylase
LKQRKVTFRLIVITDRKLAGRRLISVVSDCVKSGVKAIQLREKDLQASELARLAKKIKSSLSKSRTKLIINERLDIALLSNAEGLHSSENGTDIKYLKKYKNMIFGKSVHSVSQAKVAEKSGYDYILFGPVFRTQAKIKYGPPQGLDKLKKICNAVNIPVFAVGGITPARVKKCLKAGAYGVAAISSVMKSPNVMKILTEFKTELGGL